MIKLSIGTKLSGKAKAAIAILAGAGIIGIAIYFLAVLLLIGGID